MPQIWIRLAMSTFDPTYPHKGLHRRHLCHSPLALSSILLRLLVVVALSLKTCISTPWFVRELCLWLLDYAFMSFWFVFLVVLSFICILRAFVFSFSTLVISLNLLAYNHSWSSHCLLALIYYWTSLDLSSLLDLS